MHQLQRSVRTMVFLVPPLAALALTLVWPTPTNGQQEPLVKTGPCAVPLSTLEDPTLFEWFDLYSVDPSENLNSNAIERVLKPSTTGAGRTSLDYYSITFHRPADGNITEFFQDFRKNFAEKLFPDSIAQGLVPLDEQNARRWMSDSHREILGTVMSFGLFRSPTSPKSWWGNERGSVVVSCSDDVSWVFSTVVTKQDGSHPVSGNRAFGIHDNGDGTWTLFTKGFDRVTVSQWQDELLHFPSQPILFGFGEGVWEGLMRNLSAELSDLSPEIATHQGWTYEWDDVVQAMDPRPFETSDAPAQAGARPEAEANSTQGIESPDARDRYDTVGDPPANERPVVPDADPSEVGRRIDLPERFAVLRAPSPQTGPEGRGEIELSPGQIAIHIQSYVPFARFGDLGGILGYEGDAHGPDASPRTSARIHYIYIVDFQRQVHRKYDLWSDPSHQFLVDASLTPVSEKTPQPTGDGFGYFHNSGTFALTFQLTGKNALPPGLIATDELGRWRESWNRRWYRAPEQVTPAIDLGGTITLLRNAGSIDVGTNLHGDGFPSAQIVLQDWTGQRIVVHSHDVRHQLKEAGLISVGQMLRGAERRPMGWSAIRIALVDGTISFRGVEFGELASGPGRVKFRHLTPEVKIGDWNTLAAWPPDTRLRDIQIPRPGSKKSWFKRATEWLESWRWPGFEEDAARHEAWKARIDANRATWDAWREENDRKWAELEAQSSEFWQKSERLSAESRERTDRFWAERKAEEAQRRVARAHENEIFDAHRQEVAGLDRLLAEMREKSAAQHRALPGLSAEVSGRGGPKSSGSGEPLNTPLRIHALSLATETPDREQTARQDLPSGAPGSGPPNVGGSRPAADTNVREGRSRTWGETDNSNRARVGSSKAGSTELVRIKRIKMIGSYTFVPWNPDTRLDKTEWVTVDDNGKHWRCINCETE